MQHPHRKPMMRGKITTRIPAFAAALAAGALAAYTLRGGPASTSPTAQLQRPAAEVRTQVIRRTIHVVRHEKPPRSGRGSSSGSAATHSGGRAPGGTSAGPRTATSGARATASPSSPPRTRTSPAASGPAGAAPVSSSPVRTHTSGSTGSAKGTTGGSSSPPRTRTSGSHGTVSSPSGAVRTRTSGSGERGDGGGGHDD